MATIQSRSGLFVKRAEATDGNIRVIGRRPIFRGAAYSVIVDEGKERTVMAGTLGQIGKMLLHKRLVRDAAKVVEAVSEAVGDNSDLFSPPKVTGGISGNIYGTDIACLVAIKYGINETTQIASVFGIDYIRVHARLMSLRREGLVCREDGTLLKFFLTSEGLDIVARGMREEPFIQAMEWLSGRGEFGPAQIEAPANSY
jgi:hypothetical protein